MKLTNAPIQATAVLLSTLVLAGCTADYMSRDESISPDLGNAMAINTALMTVNPQPAAAYDTQLEHGGVAASAAVTGYQTRAASQDSASTSTASDD